MEERYRQMSSVGVRSLASFNDKVRAAKAKGQPLGRKVQIGYENGKPVYEEEQLDFSPLPQIVIVVDELADLMMTAGKEVEFLIQRLAQKARAAGIHLIMATQRPSVDVITGVIKANLPTRISFNVTSKIDSRTILGEQGAEQLLGKGDMLYMAYGKQISRVHGPFVSATTKSARSPITGARRASPITSSRSPRKTTTASRSTARRWARIRPRTSNIAARSSWWSKARRRRPAGSSARCGSATIPPRG